MINLKNIALSVICFMVLFILTKISILENVSASLPLGTYLSVPYVVLTKNNYYELCITDNQYVDIMAKLGLSKINRCDNGYSSILKELVGVPGDVISITKNGVLINNKLILDSSSVSEIRSINLYPQQIGSFVLKSNEYWFMGESKNSYDSRYFGKVTMQEIKSEVFLLWKK